MTKRFAFVLTLTASLSAAASAVPLASYFPESYSSGPPPAVRVVGGNTNPPPTAEGHESVERLLPYGVAEGEVWIGGLLYAEVLRWGLCAGEAYAIRAPGLLAGRTVEMRITYDKLSGDLTASDLPEEAACVRFTGQPPHYTYRDQAVFSAPVRRVAVDGSAYEAVPMVITRAGKPWLTYYFGYRMGLVGRVSNWTDGDLEGFLAPPDKRDDFELVKLPPPHIEGEVVEYVNRNDFPKSIGGQYFYAATKADQDALDAQENWARTGLSFKSGGYVSVCRLYGKQPQGPNSHFYSANVEECATLRGTAAWIDEGLPFRASRPIAAANGGAPTCPAATVPLYRAYNNGYSRGFDGNHRYSTQREQIAAMAGVGWVDEGVAMCVPQ